MTKRRSRMVLGVAAGLLAVGVVVPVTSAFAADAVYVADPASLVEPIIGTSGAVDDFPGADVPFGMVQWSPDTPSRPAGGGYEYNDNAVTGFSLTHVSGPGCPAAGDIPILPTSGALESNPGSATMPLNHAAETAHAGSYRLVSNRITSELTSTLRTGAGRFTFPAGSPANFILKLSDSATGSSSTSFQVVSPTEIQGSVTSGQFCGASDSYTAHFDIKFDQPMTGWGSYQDGVTRPGVSSAKVIRKLAPRVKVTATEPKSSTGIKRNRPFIRATAGAAARAKVKAAVHGVTGTDGAYVSFDTAKTSTVQMNVGLSYVSAADAKLNRTTEDPAFAFNSTQTAARASWNTLLSKIQIGGGDTAAEKTFYTALYHALLHPNVFSDVNGKYAGFDNEVHTAAKGHAEYANYSGWDIYRSQVQLAATVAPQQTSDSIRSMLNQYDQTGQLPKWALNNGESYVMVGDPAAAIIADAYAFGAKDFDTAKALSAMTDEASTPNDVRPGLSQYLDKGYLPLDGQYGCCNFYGPVSTQQEYNTADHAISSFATALGRTSVATTFARRANNWQNVFNPGTDYMQPKNTSGAFASGFTPTSSQGFVEGSAAQYTPMEPFDIKGLIEAAGGNAAWNDKLDSLTSTIKNPTSANADFGNEPSIEIPWEYDYSGEPYKAQSTVRQIQQQIFTNQPNGIAGNDDLGTMSAWYVWSALGFFPETPGTTTLALGSPVFANAAVHLPSGKTLTVTAPNAAPGAPYVQSMTSQGARWSHAYLQAGLITNGGKVSFDLGATPNTAFASAPADAPSSDTRGLNSALGYTTDSVVETTPGTPASVTLGVRNLTATKQLISWSAASDNAGVTSSPASGMVSVAGHGQATSDVAVTAPTTEGRYFETFSLRDGFGNALPNVTVEIDVAAAGALWPFYNDIGVASDGVGAPDSYDGSGHLYSEQALAAAGLTRGASVTSNGLTYTWPDVAPGSQDNIQAGGQVIPLTGPVGATRIGILGSATNGNPGSEGDFVVTYTDGSTQTINLGMTDWTLNGGGTPAPADNDTTVATTPHRDDTNGGQDGTKAYLFTTDAALESGKTVQSLTLPSTVTNGAMHVFAFAVGTPTS